MPNLTGGSWREESPPAGAEPIKRTGIPVAASMRRASTEASPIPASGTVTAPGSSKPAGSVSSFRASCRARPSQGRRSITRMAEKRGRSAASLSAEISCAASSVSLRASSHTAAPQPDSRTAQSTSAAGLQRERRERGPRARNPAARVSMTSEHRPAGIASAPPAHHRRCAAMPRRIRRVIAWRWLPLIRRSPCRPGRRRRQAPRRAGRRGRRQCPPPCRADRRT